MTARSTGRVALALLIGGAVLGGLYYVTRPGLTPEEAQLKLWRENVALCERFAAKRKEARKLLAYNPEDALKSPEQRADSETELRASDENTRRWLALWEADRRACLRGQGWQDATIAALSAKDRAQPLGLAIRAWDYSAAVGIGTLVLGLIAIYYASFGRKQHHLEHGLKQAEVCAATSRFLDVVLQTGQAPSDAVTLFNRATNPTIVGLALRWRRLRVHRRGPGAVDTGRARKHDAGRGQETEAHHEAPWPCPVVDRSTRV